MEGITLWLENCLISVELSCGVEWCVGRLYAWNCVREYKNLLKNLRRLYVRFEIEKKEKKKEENVRVLKEDSY